jgi:hypothetical protein
MANKTNATLACGHRARLSPSERDAWFDPDDKAGDNYICFEHGTQRIVSVDGPESLSKLFSL